MAIETEKEQALLLLDQVHEKSDEVSRHETALKELQNQLNKERNRSISGAKEKVGVSSKQLFSEIGEANREERAKQKLHEKRQKRAAKLMLFPMLLLLVYIFLSALAFFRLAHIAKSAAAVFNLRTLFANESVASSEFIFTMILCLFLYSFGVGIWYRRKKQYVRLLAPEEQPMNRSRITIFFVMLFIPFFMLPVWIGYLTFSLYQLSKWQVIVLSFGSLAIILILAAYRLFPAKLNKEESAYLRNAVLQDEEIRGRRECAEQAIAEASKHAARAFDSGARAKELRQEIRRLQAALERSKKELEALDLQEEYKSSGTAAIMADHLKQGRADTLKEAIDLFEQERAVKNFHKNP